MTSLDGDVKSSALSPSLFLINSSGTDKNINCSVFEKNALYLSVDVFNMKVLIGDTICTYPTKDGTAIFRGDPRHANV